MRRDFAGFFYRDFLTALTKTTSLLIKPEVYIATPARYMRKIGEDRMRSFGDTLASRQTQCSRSHTNGQIDALITTVPVWHGAVMARASDQRLKTSPVPSIPPADPLSGNYLGQVVHTHTHTPLSRSSSII